MGQVELCRLSLLNTYLFPRKKLAMHEPGTYMDSLCLNIDHIKVDPLFLSSSLQIHPTQQVGFDIILVWNKFGNWVLWKHIFSTTTQVTPRGR